MTDNQIPIGIYRHYKGNEYEVIGFSKHSETLEDMVVYKALYGEGGTWVRPLSMWDNPIELDGKTVKRFEFVGSTDKSGELIEAHKALLSTLKKCEKINPDKFAASQRTLLERRIAALKIALNLIDKELARIRK
jgi:type II secretory pathway component PulJ